MAGLDLFSRTDGQQLISKIGELVQQQKAANAQLAVIAGASRSSFMTSWDGIAQAVAQGYGPDLFSIGSTFSEPWTDTAASNTPSYDNPWRVNHFSDVETESGETVHGMWLENSYVTPFGVQFSYYRAFLACPDGLAAGTYHLTLGETWGNNAVKGKMYQFTLSKAVEKGGRLAGFYGMPDQSPSTWKVYSYGADGRTLNETVSVTEGTSGTDLGTMALSKRSGNMNSMHETAYGWNRWKTSAMRQWLNSDRSKGQWWTPQDQWDIAPDQLADKDGFLCGLPADMKNAIIPVKTITYVNTVNDGTNDSYDITYDRVSLISLEQMYINPQHAGEGEAHEYWKRVNGTATKWQQWQTYPILKHYGVDNPSVAQYLRLRSAGRGYAYRAWFVGSSGNVGDDNAGVALRCSPLVVIGKSR